VSTYDLGDVVTLPATVNDAAGAPGNAGTMVCTITTPAGTTVTPSVTNPATGTYTATYVPAAAGRYLVRWVSTGDNAGAFSDDFQVTAAGERMTFLATASDVERRLGRALTAEESARTQGLLAEASALVLGHLGSAPNADEALDVVAIVVSRMVARVLEQAGVTGGAFGATAMTDQIGDFSQSRSFAPGSTSGGPWLSKADKLALRQVRDSGAFAVDTAPVGAWHTDICSVSFGASFCDCGSALNAGNGPVAGAG
jgi:hypothetical protein